MRNRGRAKSEDGHAYSTLMLYTAPSSIFGRDRDPFSPAFLLSSWAATRLVGSLSEPLVWFTVLIDSEIFGLAGSSPEIAVTFLFDAHSSCVSGHGRLCARVVCEQFAMLSSESITLTNSLSPTATTSSTLSTRELASWEMCSSPSFENPRILTNAPNGAMRSTVPGYIWLEQRVQRHAMCAVARREQRLWKCAEVSASVTQLGPWSSSQHASTIAAHCMLAMQTTCRDQRACGMMHSHGRPLSRKVLCMGACIVVCWRKHETNVHASARLHAQCCMRPHVLNTTASTHRHTASVCGV